MLCPKCSASLEDNAKFCDSCGNEVDTTPKDPLVGRILLNQYVVRKKLGEGGYGAVYEADQPTFRRKVAIKTLHKHLTSDPKVVKRFHREGMVASQLEKNPSAVKMLNAGETEDGYLWIAMEFISGETLDERIQKKPLSIPELLEIMGPVCNLLDEAHQKTIIHRDLKPDNIMLTEHQGKIIPKVLDFGIAGIVDQHETSRPTQTGVVTGTPPYMPPEQWKGLKHTDHRSDIYSLGVIVYECISGKLPFEADTVPDWMIRHVMQEPKKLSDVMAGNPLPKGIDGAVLKALAKEPNDRYQSAGEFFRALSEASAGASSASLQRAPIAEMERGGEVATMPHMSTSPLSASASLPGNRAAVGEVPISNAQPAPNSPTQKTGLIVAGVLVAAGATGYLLFSGSKGSNVAPKISVAVPNGGNDPGAVAQVQTPWRPVTSGTSYDLRAISGGGNSIFAVGDGGVIARSTDGNVWTIDELDLAGGFIIPGRSPELLDDVWVSPQQEPIIVHEGSIFRGVGENVTGFDISRRETFRSVWGTPNGALILAGSGAFFSNDGVQWVGASGFGRRDVVLSLWGRDSLVVASGQGGLIAISRDQGGNWQRVNSNIGVSLNGVSGDANHIYIAGEGGVFLVGDAQGATWTQQKTGTTASLQAVWVAADGAIYVVGTQGTILMSRDEGKTWTKQDSQTTQTLFDIWGSPSGALFAVGAAGTIVTK